MRSKMRSNKKMTVFVFGNPDLPADSLAVRILPELRGKFPEIDFRLKDPNEDFELPEGVVVIDVVAGLEGPRVFSSFDDFQTPPRMTLHDFDLFGHLQLLKKLGKLSSKLKIIGLPPMMSEKEAIACVTVILRAGG
jgi:hypothetical protein